MQFQNWGEDPFIEFLAKEFPAKKGFSGIGDDCAVIPPNGLVTQDALIEGIHFLKDQIPPQDLGYKTVAVNVSDIAAMGGAPKYGFLTLALPKTTEVIWIKQFFKGIKEACKKWDIQLLGGDTVGSKRDIFINMTLMGTGEKVKYRKNAKEGDVICVTGYLGDSGGGLKALQEGVNAENLIQRHFRPEPSIEHGKQLASLSNVHAMMDISDGLDCDLRRLLKASGTGAVIDIDKIPISSELSQICAQNGWDLIQLVLTGGEDYCLLFTAEEEGSFFPIGHVTKEGLVYQKEGKAISINYPSFNHFR